MPISPFETLNIIEALENFLDKKRPPEVLRSKLDLNYEIYGQSVVIFEIRPQWDDRNKIMHIPIAKTTYVARTNTWKVFWMKSDQKWHSYKAVPVVQTIRDFVKLVEKDEHYCFFG